MHNFTPEDLLEFYYGEMPESIAADLRIQLETNWSLKQKLSVIDEAATRLNKSIISPRTEVVDRIMVYASKQLEYS